MDLQKRFMDIRKQYHALERQIHKKEWSTEEDALAFLTDAGLVGRQIMAKEGRWPSGDEEMLPAKIGGMCLVAGRFSGTERWGIRCLPLSCFFSMTLPRHFERR